jgi:hypothetical protein
VLVQAPRRRAVRSMWRQFAQPCTLQHRHIQAFMDCDGWSLESIVFSSRTCRSIVGTATLTTGNYYTDDWRCACRRTWGMAFRTMSRNSAGGFNPSGSLKTRNIFHRSRSSPPKFNSKKKLAPSPSLISPRLSHRRCLTLVSSAAVLAPGRTFGWPRAAASQFYRAASSAWSAAHFVTLGTRICLTHLQD